LKGKLVRFFNGGVTLEYLDNISIPELLDLDKVAGTLNDEEERAINNGK
jgi:hypothetical protein